jgi:DNA-binding response OmpR family regulator
MPRIGRRIPWKIIHTLSGQILRYYLNHNKLALTNKKKILIIDDESDLCLLMKSYFVRKNYDVYSAATLQEGLIKMEEVLPDILFLDNNLPDGIGWTKVESFLHVNPSLRLFLMSGYPPTFPNIPGFSYEVLIKPISFADLEIL